MNVAGLVTALVLSADGGVNPVTGLTLDAGPTPYVTFSDPLYASCPEAPPAIAFDGGALYLPPLRAARVACLMETCDVARHEEQGMLTEPPQWWNWGVALFGFGLAAGTALGSLVK